MTDYGKTVGFRRVEDGKVVKQRIIAWREHDAANESGSDLSQEAANAAATALPAEAAFAAAASNAAIVAAAIEAAADPAAEPAAEPTAANTARGAVDEHFRQELHTPRELVEGESAARAAKEAEPAAARAAGSDDVIATANARSCAHAAAGAREAAQAAAVACKTAAASAATISAAAIAAAGIQAVAYKPSLVLYDREAMEMQAAVAAETAEASRYSEKPWERSSKEAMNEADARLSMSPKTLPALGAIHCERLYAKNLSCPTADLGQMAKAYGISELEATGDKSDVARAMAALGLGPDSEKHRAVMRLLSQLLELEEVDRQQRADTKRALCKLGLREEFYLAPASVGRAHEALDSTKAKLRAAREQLAGGEAALQQLAEAGRHLVPTGVRPTMNDLPVGGETTVASHAALVLACGSHAALVRNIEALAKTLRETITRESATEAQIRCFLDEPSRFADRKAQLDAWEGARAAAVGAHQAQTAANLFQALGKYAEWAGAEELKRKDELSMATEARNLLKSEREQRVKNGQLGQLGQEAISAAEEAVEVARRDKNKFDDEPADIIKDLESCELCAVFAALGKSDHAPRLKAALASCLQLLNGGLAVCAVKEALEKVLAAVDEGEDGDDEMKGEEDDEDEEGAAEATNGRETAAVDEHLWQEGGIVEGESAARAAKKAKEPAPGTKRERERDEADQPEEATTAKKPVDSWWRWW